MFVVRVEHALIPFDGVGAVLDGDDEARPTSHVQSPTFEAFDVDGAAGRRVLAAPVYSDQTEDDEKDEQGAEAEAQKSDHVFHRRSVLPDPFRITD